MDTKQCSKCKQFKSISEFHRNRSTKDGHQNQCKICFKYHLITEKSRAYRRRYRKSEKGKFVNLKSMKRFYTRHPERRKAGNAINNAIQVGKLPRPDSLQCYYCPAQAQEYHHHLGYEPKRWLDVIPVCRKCHQKCKRKIA